MKKLLIGTMLPLFLIPLTTTGGKSCDNARCHEGVNSCEPGNSISLRPKCDSYSCFIAGPCEYNDEIEWLEVAP